MTEETVKIRYPVPGEFLNHIVDADSLKAIKDYFQYMYGVTPSMVLPDHKCIIVHLPYCKEATMLALRYPVIRSSR